MSGHQEIIGIGAEHAQVIAGGAVGAGLRLYLRPAGSIARSVVTFALCVGSASAFGQNVQSLTGLNAGGAGGVVALVSLGVAEGILRAVERFDFAGLLKRKLP